MKGNDMRIIDLHCDTILYCCMEGKTLRDFPYHINLDKLKTGGSLAQCFALFIPTHEDAVEHFGKEQDPWETYEQLLAYYRKVMEDAADSIRPALSPEDVLKNRQDGFLSSILTIEDGVEIDGKIERLDRVYEDGVRMIALTWNYENCIGYPNTKNRKKHTTLGLKPFGIEAVERMNELGIIVDVSHLSEAGFYDVAKYSKKPFAASHSCARALKDHSRNLTDDQLRVLGEAGGVVGINFYDGFLGDLGGHTTIEAIVSHVLRMRDKAGLDALALGSDFDGIESTLEFGDYSGYPKLLDALGKHFTDDEMDKICNGNFLRVFGAQD